MFLWLPSARRKKGISGIEYSKNLSQDGCGNTHSVEPLLDHIVFFQWRQNINSLIQAGTVVHCLDFNDLLTIQFEYNVRDDAEAMVQS